MAPPEDDGAAGGGGGNPGGNGGNQAVVSRMKSLELGGLCDFDPKGDPTTLCARWKKWKRAFNLYVKSKGVTEEEQKVALLLHTGGMDLQEVYYSLVPEERDLTLKESLKVLDDHFVPSVNVPFERHLFRQLEQGTEETVDQFVCRLRQRSASCDFADVDEAIRDQLIEKCRDQRLRRKFLERSGDGKLKDLQDIARAYEAVEAQMRSMNRTTPAAQVNAVQKKDGGPKTGKWAGKGKPQGDKGKPRRDKRCFNCGHSDHFSVDQECPARGRTCNKCGGTGHFALCCPKDKAGDARPKPQGWKGQGKRRAYQVAGDTPENGAQEEQHHAFHVGNGPSDGVVDLKIGGVTIKSVLIDSGASCNLMDKATWDVLKARNVKAVSQKSDKKLFAYGQSEPIEILTQR